jgi:hypothetical protein
VFRSFTRPKFLYIFNILILLQYLLEQMHCIFSITSSYLEQNWNGKRNIRIVVLLLQPKWNSPRPPCNYHNQSYHSFCFCLQCSVCSVLFAMCLKCMFSIHSSGMFCFQYSVELVMFAMCLKCMFIIYSSGIFCFQQCRTNNVCHVLKTCMLLICRSAIICFQFLLCRFVFKVCVHYL